jgi:hypothetical protein
MMTACLGDDQERITPVLDRLCPDASGLCHIPRKIFTGPFQGPGHVLSACLATCSSFSRGNPALA